MKSPISDTSAFGYEAVPATIPSEEPALSLPNPTPHALPAENMSTTAPQWNVNVPNNPSQEPHLGAPNQTPIEMAQSVACVHNVHQAPPVVNMSPAAPQWNVNAPLPQVPNAFHQTFLKAKPFALGLVLMIAGTMSLSTGIGMIFVALRISLISGNPFWGGLTYVITGIITLSTHSEPSICRVKSSLAMNILSSLMSGISIVFACLDLAVLPACIYYQISYQCSENAGAIAVHALALINNMLIFSVSLFLGVKGCIALNNEPSVQQVFLVQNGAMVPYPTSTTISQPQYPVPYFVQAEVKNQPTAENMQSH